MNYEACTRRRKPTVPSPVARHRGLRQVAQIMGPPFAELQCLAAAEAIERQVMPLTSVKPWNGG